MGGFEQEFFMFDLLSIIVPLFFVFVFGLIIFSIGKNINEWNHNNKQPRLTVPAMVVSKRTQVRGGQNDTSAHTAYYVTFEVESGDRMEMHVNGQEYGLLAEGDLGELSFQGTRYLGFARNKSTTQTI
ncbi:hypothetical protein A8F94_01460 [Bacillus sp. FJAT-27225]|uniref:DUF2500 domain-containing protein n=1 Tax=Bacillus sp. FJAT-27225 TaxID=1743144 RepID=UPI00080C2EDD|nr:DUF2500 domain-containing protein [Bacillus sp. FJAT-27225]OCA90577.1 hypothetical protein A8F94_01460 [Bacillus sp. FJAT-27225]